MHKATLGKYARVAAPFGEEQLLAVRAFREELDLDNDIMCSEHVVVDDDWGAYYVKKTCVDEGRGVMRSNMEFAFCSQHKFQELLARTFSHGKNTAHHRGISIPGLSRR